MDSETNECAYAGTCPDNNDANGFICSWKRILCVTCYVDASVTKIRIQTNSLPNHCYFATTNPPISAYVDLVVEFNKAVVFNAATLLPTQEITTLTT